MRKYLLLLFSFIYFQPFFCPKKKETAENVPADKTLTIQKNISDSALLDLVEKQTFRYFGILLIL